MPDRDFARFDENRQTNIKFVLDLCFVCVLSAFSLYASNAGFGWLASVISIVYILFTVFQPFDDSFVYILFGISNTHVLSLLGASISVALCCVIALIQMFSAKKIRGSLFGILVLYFVYSLQFLLRFSSISDGIVMPLKMIGIILFYYFYSSVQRKAGEVRRVLRKCVIYTSAGIASNLIVSMVLSSSFRAHVLNNDSNMLAVESAVLLSIAFVLYFRKQIISKTDLVFVFCTLSFTIAACGSRNGFLLYGVAVLVTLICNIRKLNKLTFFVLFVSVFLVAFLMSDFGQQVIQNYQYRTDLLVRKGDISNGRFELWDQYISMYRSDKTLLFLGIGTKDNVGIDYMAHNGIIEDIGTYGLIGLIIVWVAYLIVRKTYYENNYLNIHSRIDFYSLLPAMLIFLGSLTLRGLTSIINLSLLFCTLMCYCAGEFEKG